MLILAFASLFVGVTDISFFSLLNGINQDVFIISRIPRTISIIIAGASLSICGLIMQQLTQNKFVSPTTAGTMDCVKLGILFTMIFFGTASFLNQVIISSIFAILGSFVFLQIIRKIRLKDIIFVPLIGLMFGGIINSITTFFAYQLNLIQNVQIWLQGNFSNVMQGSYELIYISLPLLVLAYIYANKITIAGMGEDIALNLGVSYRFILNLGLIIVAIITSIIVLTVGILPFLGLIIPNIISIYKGDNIRKNIINIALLGAVFLLICDIFSRLVIYPFEIPIGLTVGVIGSFVFILLLLRKKEYA
ncbi:iron chelate uptake ABC transporter family permease subunit [uncultured Campylobacter sp.]|uniref:ABC transporter permease n=1 Tax=uncultured Campylobacter sp. TaxID=218934 RepID=UPI0026318AB9|nr:iron chelate uptake ABC transporter family permease subunit [uncultured Campylobacter sp.]